jgi:hypothetical protein
MGDIVGIKNHHEQSIRFFGKFGTAEFRTLNYFEFWENGGFSSRYRGALGSVKPKRKYGNVSGNRWGLAPTIYIYIHTPGIMGI